MGVEDFCLVSLSCREYYMLCKSKDISMYGRLPDSKFPNYFLLSVSVSDYTATNVGFVNGELEKTWKKSGVASSRYNHLSFPKAL